MTQGIVPPRLTSENHAPPDPGSAGTHTRRTALARLATASAMAVTPGVTLAGEPDPHPAWARECHRLIGLCTTDREMDDDELDAICIPLADLEDRICLTPARTLAGAREPLAYLRRTIRHNQPGEREEAALANVQATIEALIGSAVHV